MLNLVVQKIHQEIRRGSTLTPNILEILKILWPAVTSSIKLCKPDQKFQGKIKRSMVAARRRMINI